MFVKLMYFNIVMIFEFGWLGFFYYFFMEYVDGVNLWELILMSKVIFSEVLFII